MKKTIFFTANCFLFAILFSVTNNSFAQSGIECDWCHGMNGNHNAGCRYLGTSEKTSTSSSQSVSIEQEIMTQIFAGMIKNMFSATTTPETQQSDEEKQKQLQEEKLRQQRLDELMKRQKRMNDSIAQVRHDKMMKDYKPLDSTGNVAFKGLDDGNQFQKINFSCKMTEFKGQVVVVKSDGKKTVLTEESIVDLAPGDWIATGPNSRVKLHYAFEKGGKDVILGQNSGMTVVVDEDGQNTPKLVKGRMYSFSNIASENFVKLEEELLSLQNKIVNEPDRIKRRFLVRMYEMKNRNRLLLPTFALAVRGTEFTASVDSLGNSYVYLINGAVDIIDKFDGSVVMLTPGSFGVVNAEGKVIKVEKFDVEKFERWWED